MFKKIVCFFKGHNFFFWPKREQIVVDRYGTTANYKTRECRRCDKIELVEI